MADKVIAVDLDEAAQALKLLADYMPGGGGLVCTVGGVPGTSEGAANSFYWRLANLEYNVAALAKAISENIQEQHLAILQTVQALVAADDSLAEGAAKLLAQIESMAPPELSPVAPATTDEGIRLADGMSAR